MGALKNLVTDMTKEEAYEMMKAGHKIYHRYFGDDEYLYMDESGTVRSEEGYDFDEWWEDGVEWKKEGWNIRG